MNFWKFCSETFFHVTAVDAMTQTNVYTILQEYQHARKQRYDDDVRTDTMNLW